MWIAWLVIAVVWYLVGVYSYLYSFGLGRYSLTLKEIKNGLVIGGIIGVPVTVICGVLTIFRRKLV